MIVWYGRYYDAIITAFYRDLYLAHIMLWYGGPIMPSY
jgi:hypothetical protein